MRIEATVSVRQCTGATELTALPDGRLDGQFVPAGRLVGSGSVRGWYGRRSAQRPAVSLRPQDLDAIDVVVYKDAVAFRSGSEQPGGSTEAMCFVPQAKPPPAWFCTRAGSARNASSKIEPSIERTSGDDERSRVHVRSGPREVIRRDDDGGMRHAPV